MYKFVRFRNAEIVITKAFADYGRCRIHSAPGHITPNELACESRDVDK